MHLSHMPSASVRHFVSHHTSRWPSGGIMTLTERLQFSSEPRLNFFALKLEALREFHRTRCFPQMYRVHHCPYSPVDFVRSILIHPTFPVRYCTLNVIAGSLRSPPEGHNTPCAVLVDLRRVSVLYTCLHVTQGNVRLTNHVPSCWTCDIQSSCNFLAFVVRFHVLIAWQLAQTSSHLAISAITEGRPFFRSM